MNKKANIFTGIVLFLLIFFTGVLIIPYFTDDIVSVRTLLSCASPLDISDGTKLMCLNIDLLIPYFIWFITSVSLGYLGGKN